MKNGYESDFICSGWSQSIYNLAGTWLQQYRRRLSVVLEGLALVANHNSVHKRILMGCMHRAGHDMTVYAVKWNNIHQRIFLSASADWTLKLWEGDNPRPVMSFDLNNPVGDAAWSPHSATVFAAVTDDGKVVTHK